jgi:hypothetical protein
VRDLERELLALRERVSASIRPSPGIADRVLRRAAIRRLVTAVTSGLVAVTLGLGSVAAVRAFDPEQTAPVSPRPDEESSTAPSLDFEPAPGWYVRSSDRSTEADFGGQAWASNIPFVKDEEPIGAAGAYPGGWPEKTEDALPPDGILIVAQFVIQTRNRLPPIREAPERALPLTIDQEPSVAYEGRDAGRAMAVVNATVKGHWINVRVVFGTGKPTAALVREAEEELARLVPPPAADPTEAIDDFGIHMTLPSSWRGILFCCPGAGPSLIAATVPITDLYVGSSVRRRLGADDVFLVLSENDASAIHYEPVVLPVGVQAEDDCPTCEIMDNGTSPPRDHSLFYRSFAVAGRQFDLFVEMGDATPTDEQLAEVNDVLATLEITPSESSSPGDSPVAAPEGPISVERPAGWIRKDVTLSAPRAPRLVAVYGTWDFPTGGDCGPEAALQDLPADGAMVWILEHWNPGYAGDFVPLMSGFGIDLQTPPARWECAAGAPSRMYLLRVGGRLFEVHVALGPGAQSETVRQAEALVKSLEAEPAP